MTVLVIFQSHIFFTCQHSCTSAISLISASLFYTLFELGNNCPYRLTRPRNTGNLGNPFASNNLSNSPIQYIRFTSTVAHFIEQNKTNHGKIVI